MVACTYTMADDPGGTHNMHINAVTSLSLQIFKVIDLGMRVPAPQLHELPTADFMVATSLWLGALAVADIRGRRPGQLVLSDRT